MNKLLKTYLSNQHNATSTKFILQHAASLNETIQLSPSLTTPVIDAINNDNIHVVNDAQKVFDNETNTINTQIQTQKENSTAQYHSLKEKLKKQNIQNLSKIELKFNEQVSTVSGDALHLIKEGKNHFKLDQLAAETVRNSSIQLADKNKKALENKVKSINKHYSDLIESYDMVLKSYKLTKIKPEAFDIRSQKETNDDFQTPYDLAINNFHSITNAKRGKIFSGQTPYLLAIIPTIFSAALIFYLNSNGTIGNTSFVSTAVGAALTTLTAIIVLGFIIRKKTIAYFTKLINSFQLNISQYAHNLDCYIKQQHKAIEQSINDAINVFDTETKQSKDKLDVLVSEVTRRSEAQHADLQTQHKIEMENLNEKRHTAITKLDENYSQGIENLETEYQRLSDAISQKFEQKILEINAHHTALNETLQSRWQNGLRTISQFDHFIENCAVSSTTCFKENYWQKWTPDKSNNQSHLIRIGQFSSDSHYVDPQIFAALDNIVDPNNQPNVACFDLTMQKSILIQTTGEGKTKAINGVKALILRMFATLPPGRANFTIIDPIGLGEHFSGFMHGGDYDEKLVGGRIWTNTGDIQRELEDLTEHMENVIQKYLRNEFDSIEAYNKQAGELAEPYRFLVISDFPSNFNDEAIHRLSSIIQSGPRCGVYTILICDSQNAMPPNLDLGAIAQKSIHLIYNKNVFIWQGTPFSSFDLTLDTPPEDALLTTIMHKVGEATNHASRIEVPFATIAPSAQQRWSMCCAKELTINIGRTGATRLQSLKLGRGVEQHILIAGKTGSGKSTLLHVIISNLALWYSPDEVELYLIDFKKGVEFKTYVTHQLPHIRSVAIESDREFGLSILKKLDSDMNNRGEMFREAGVQDLAGYRETTGKTLPRIILIVDEFQIFFNEDDNIAHEATLLLEQIVRQGRAFGVHAILGSQTLSGTAGLPRSTVGQMAVRIAMQCSEGDSQLILDDDNTAARLLSRPGEAIYNNAGGMLSGNSPFQCAWLNDDTRDDFLMDLNNHASSTKKSYPKMLVFEGNKPADISTNPIISDAINNKKCFENKIATVWLGEPVAIKPPTEVLLRRQTGANLLIVGQNDHAALGLLSASINSLDVQCAMHNAQMYIIDGTPTDSPLAGKLSEVTKGSIMEINHVDYRNVTETISQLWDTMQARLNNDTLDGPSIFIMINALQRFRVLRKSEDDFSFSTDVDETPKPDKLFAEILREGPVLGIHTFVWADTYTTIERTFDRNTLREFDFRALFQMSATDSSNLIDNTLANKLGQNRALFYSEEQGIIEKLRPYQSLENWLP